MNVSLINPHIRYMDMRGSIKPYSDFVMAYDYRIFYVLDGEITVYTDQLQTVSANSLIIIPPAKKYKLSPSEKSRFIVINFDISWDCPSDMFRPPDSECNFDPSLIFSDKVCEALPEILPGGIDSHNKMTELFSVFSEKKPYYSELSSAMLKEVIVFSLRNISKSSIPESAEKIIGFVCENFTKNITNADIGQHFCYHPNYINRIFKQYTGSTIKKYILNLRLEKAAELIRSGESNSEILCRLCGFESKPYFIKCFHKKYGLPPLQYKKQLYKSLL